jgi:hypothetical protein
MKHHWNPSPTIPRVEIPPFEVGERSIGDATVPTYGIPGHGIGSRRNTRPVDRETLREFLIRIQAP